MPERIGPPAPPPATTPESTIRPENPFSTRYTRPGALPYLPAEGGLPLTPADVAARVQTHPRSCITGPHGTGKTTLLIHLRGPLDRLSEHPSQLVTLRIGDGSAELWQVLATVPRGGILIVDGYEQLTLIDRWRLIYRAWRRDIRLLVTAHRPPWGFHRLADTGTPQSIARQLATLLLSEFPEQREAMLKRFDQRWRAAEGNIRQLWATLYEDFEDQLPPSPR